MERYHLKDQFERNPRLTLPCHKSNIYSIRWNPDGNVLASGGKDTVLHLHRVAESRLIFEKRYSTIGHSNDISQLCWCPENSNLLATASIDRTVKVWDARITDPVATIKLKSENMAVSWSSVGSTIAVADKADLVSFIDTKSGFEVLKDQKFQFGVGEITWNKENDLFFVTCGDGKVYVMSYPDLQLQYVIDAFATRCVCIRFDATGKYFALGANDAVASVWDSDNLACIQAIDRPDKPITAVSFSYDSKYLATGSEDSLIDVADIHTGEQFFPLDVKHQTLSLDFHPKDYILAYALNEPELIKCSTDKYSADKYSTEKYGTERSSMEKNRDVGTIKMVGYPDTRRREYN